MPEDDPSPTDAFALLGDETRVGILRALGEAAGPLSFSTLRERVGTRDSGRFNYHLDRLVGHFVARTDEGYTLRRVGERVVVAVQSGSVTATPELGPTLVDESCPFCGAQVGVHYREERLGVFCTECAGAYSGGGPADRPSATSGPDDGSGAAGDRTAGGDGDDGGEAAVDVAEAGHLGTLFVPPAGVAARGRDADALLGAALTWTRWRPPPGSVPAVGPAWTRRSRCVVTTRPVGRRDRASVRPVAPATRSASASPAGTASSSGPARSA
jgi:DNA-binding transcriptional ArsR family regulator